MLLKRHPQDTLDWQKFLSVAIFIVFVYHLLRYVQPDIWGRIYCVYYMFLVPALIAVYLSHRQL